MTMQISVFNKQRNTKAEEYARERLELVIGQFADRISHVELQFVDENGAKGGVDKICTIDIKLIPRGQIHVRAKNEDLFAAIVKAIHRAETVVAKAVDKRHRSHEVRHNHSGIRNIPPDLEAIEEDSV